MSRRYCAIVAAAILCLSAWNHAHGAEILYRQTDSLDIDRVPSWFPVGFSLLTSRDSQFVAYYNEHHQLIVASRELHQRTWRKVSLPTKVGWDSHNGVTMAVDTTGRLHLAGNMHCDPLLYFRTERPGDISTFQRHSMTGQDETRCTYPRFFTSNEGQLLFLYRSGSSGNGRRLCNGYDAATMRWERFLDVPLFDGEDQRNAYPKGPVQGPDGLFHLVWVWRDTPDCATNHHLSYARSRDLRHWESAGGEELTLPLTLSQSSTWVDPIPSGGGIINGCEHLSFDRQQRPVLVYHKRDRQGFMQVFAARFEKTRWIIRPLTKWDKEIPFSGRGAMPFIGIAISSLKPLAPDKYYLTYRHRDYGGGTIVVDENTLQPLSLTVSIPQEYPANLRKPTMDFPGLNVRLAADLGHAPSPNVRYVLRWETLDAHHDRPRQPPLPEPSTLQLIRLEKVR